MDKVRTGLAGPMQLCIATLLTLVVALAALLCGGCHSKPDPNREFAMTMNGEEYPSHLGSPFGSLQEIEAGFSTQLRCHIIFPLRLPGTRRPPGVEIEVDPQRIRLGEEIVFGQGASDSGVDVSYSPMHGHRMSEGVMLTFACRQPDGGGTIRFDQLEATLGGRAKGKLIEATLYGYFEDANTAQASEPSEPRKLRLRNFPFDVTLEQSPF
jgi:hypothetical protein